MRSFARLPFRLATQHFSTRAFVTEAQAQATSVTKPGWSIWSKALLAAPPTILAGWIVLSDEPQRRARVAYNVPLRVFRDAVAVISIASGVSNQGFVLRITNPDSQVQACSNSSS